MVTSYSDGARRRRGVRGALLRAIGVAVALAAVAACGSNKSKEEASAPAELVDFEQQYRVVALWSKGIGTGQGKEYNRLQPALDQDFIYAADVDGVVLALDRLTGKKVWKAKVGKQLTGAVGVGRDLVVLGNARGEVIALARDDGRELWRARVGGEVLAPPATDGNVVVAQTFDGKLYALDGATGAELWRYTSQLPVLTLRGTAAPVVEFGRVYAAFANGKLVSLDLASGVVNWEARVAVAQGESEIERVVDVDGTPLVEPDTIFAVSYQGRAGAFDPRSGRPYWYHDASSYVGMAEGFGHAYVASDEGALLALDQRNGNVSWVNEQLLHRRLSQPVTVGSLVVVADYQGYIHVISQIDGTLVARRKLGSKGVRAPLLSADGVLYALGNKGKLTAYQIAE